MEAALPPGSTLAPGTIVGGYRIEAVAGRGGMGVVYRAIQLALDRPVALKLLSPELAQDDAFRERFQRESKLLASIDHPSVIAVHEAGEHDGRLFIAMRYVVGTDLRELIANQGKLEPVRATEILAQVASALDAAHARGLIHRDVKPANILIDEHGGREHAYLSDFGLTKQVGSSAAELTASGQWVGTVDYIAPEQVLGHAVDGRADVYALGCVLYMILTGSVPFERPSAIATVFAHVNDAAPSLSDALPGVSPHLEAAVARALAKDPEDRFQSAGDLGRAALAAAKGDVVVEPERSVARGAAAPTGGGDVPPASETVVASPATRKASRRVGRRTVIAALAVLAAAAVAVVIALGSGGGSSNQSEGDAVHVASLAVQSVPVPDGPTGVAVGEGAVWVAQSFGKFIVPLDPETGKPGQKIRVGDGPARIAAGEGSVFVSAGGGLVRVDPKKGQVTGRTTNVNMGDGGELAIGDGALFATSKADGQVVKLDPVTARVITRRNAPEPGLDGPLAVGAGSVWIATNGDNEGIVARFDTSSLTLQERIHLGTGTVAAGLAFGNGVLWVADWNRNRVYRIDPATNGITARIKVDTGISSDDIAVGGGAVWVASTGDHRVVRIAAGSNGVIGRPTPVTTTDESELAVGPHAAWITDPDGGSVTRLGF